MNLLKSIQLRSEGPACRQCVHFQNDPARIEATFSGLTAMSSGYASVRDRDGLCERHQLYLSARDRCSDFTTHPAPPTPS
jgi:hypothetical protein